MAIYPTKTSKLNNRNLRLRKGITLISVFSLLLLLVVFNFFEMFSIIILGSFGLIFYPICLFFITVGILTLCNKSIVTSKSITTFSILWLIIFVMILQIATSKSIDSGFGEYIHNTFVSCSTAGGVLFAVLVYPLNLITYTLASYIILTVFLVIFTAILIDKIRLEIINRKFSRLVEKRSNNANIEENFVNADDDMQDDELSIASTIAESADNLSDEDIFIADDEDSKEREEAKEILGLSKSRSQSSDDESSLDIQQDNFRSRIDTRPELSALSRVQDMQERKKESSKPNIYVHEDNSYQSINNSPMVSSINNKSNLDDKAFKEEERRKSAMEYLNISQGNFKSKTNKKGAIDNVEPNKNIEKNQTNNNFNIQKSENEDRLGKLNDLSSRISSLNNKSNGLTVGQNPFKNNDNFYSSNDNDNTFNKKQTSNNYQPNSINISSPFDSMPSKAKDIYSGNNNNDIVDAKSYGSRQISINDTVSRSKPNQKVYTKPPSIYNRPPLDLLNKYENNQDDDIAYIQEKGNLIVETLKSFKLEARIINAAKGPTFTRYELQMLPGYSVNSVNSKINDLAMVLESRCRVQVPIPGKNAFGIEVPNKKRQTVGIRDIIESEAFQKSKSPLTFALGKDIANECKVAAIDKMIHTLVAGSSGSGKSVCLNSILLSLLYKASPDILKLILVDPKQVEFSKYNGLPHMLIPNTITDCEKAVMALQWLIDEMEKRYKRLSDLGVRNIADYNDTDEVKTGSVEKMYYIVMIFDEVGDFMSVAKKEIEEKVMRLAAKSRACGIHLILATQRPTVDVMTGTIKANLTSRIAFTVQSGTDSKTILDCIGAESLLGMGDMLFLPNGVSEPSRIQCCFVNDKPRNELDRVIAYIKDNNEAEFDEEIETQMFTKNDGFESTVMSMGNGVDDAFDPLLKDCLKFFLKSKKCSVSSLQGYFGIGYPKANKIVMQMEKASFVSPPEGTAGKRQIYISPEEFEERFGESID